MAIVYNEGQWYMRNINVSLISSIFVIARDSHIFWKIAETIYRWRLRKMKGNTSLITLLSHRLHNYDVLWLLGFFWWRNEPFVAFSFSYIAKTKQQQMIVYWILTNYSPANEEWCCLFIYYEIGYQCKWTWETIQHYN